jgi:hypothetical protein
MMTKDVEHFFMYLLNICISSFENCSVYLPIYGLDYLFFWCLIFLSSLYILDINPISDELLAKTFSNCIGCLW